MPLNIKSWKINMTLLERDCLKILTS